MLQVNLRVLRFAQRLAFQQMSPMSPAEMTEMSLHEGRNSLPPILVQGPAMLRASAQPDQVKFTFCLASG